MGRGSTQQIPFEFILGEKGLTEKDIGWVLSKLDNQEYNMDNCHYIAYVISEDSSNNAKDFIVNQYFDLTINGKKTEETIKDLFSECIDKKKIWKVLEKYFGVICIHLPYLDGNGERYLFVCGSNKKCPEIITAEFWPFTLNKKADVAHRNNPLVRSSLRLIQLNDIEN